MNPESISQNGKISAEHLARKAYVYVRQSTMYQVENHLESQRRQYELAEQAIRLGWSRERVVVIDEDQGKSGSNANHRSGFGRLVTAVGLGEVGIVMSLEASRLARNSPDWHNLIYMSRYTGTLIADEHGIYDPSSQTDRMVLGFRGQMSELELDTSIHRMIEGRLNKARRGEFLFYPPAGYDLDELRQYVITGDESVKESIRSVFAKFAELGSVKRVCKWWQAHGLKVPVRRRTLRNQPIVWMAPIYRMFLYILHHPIYAGAYVFGRHKTTRELSPSGAAQLRVRRSKVPQEAWPILLKGHHEAYISWTVYEANQTHIRGNLQIKPRDGENGCGPVREGWALLQGILRCGACGRAMYVAYGGGNNNARTRTLQYRCDSVRRNQAGETCQVAGGTQLNDEVATVFLAATAHASTEVARLATQEISADEASAETMWRHQLEQAEYEAGRAERQFHGVEPENRLVARTLEARWNAALRRVEEVKSQTASKRQEVRPLSVQEKVRAAHLAEDLASVWHATSTTNQDRKNLLRAAIEEVQLRSEEKHYAVKIVWKGGLATEHEVKRRRRSDSPARATDKDIVEMVRLLAAEFDDAQIARVLIKQGRLTGAGNSFSAHNIAQLRNRNDIVPHSKRGGSDTKEGPFTADQVAVELGVASRTVLGWLRDGILPGRQIAPCAPWRIALTDELRKRLTSTEAPVGWVGLTEAAKQLGVSKQQVAYLVKTQKLPAVRVKIGSRQCWKIDVSSATCGAQTRLI